jgi:hypothetical protein
MKVYSNRLIIIILLFISLKMQGQEIINLLPAANELYGWNMTENPQVFNGDHLYDLIDGGADIYYEYGFNQVVSAHYTDPSLNNILVEIYEMTDATSAYGIFSITQIAAEWSDQYGELSAVNEDYISFWKSKYYVNLSWTSRQHLDGPILAGLADMIAQKIPDEGNDLPSILQSFKSVVTEKKAIYLKGNLALSNFYYFDYKDIFTVKDAIAWTHDGYHKIIIDYPDQAKAVEIIAGVKQSFSSSKRFSDVAVAFQGFSCKDNKGNFILIRQVEKYIVILVALDGNSSPVPFIDEIAKEIEKNVN